MNIHEGTATLEWWANRSTCLSRLGVRVTVRVTGSEWTCDAILDPPVSAEDREGFDFLMELDPLFTLRFDEGSTFLVNVVAAGTDGRLILTAHQAEAAKSADGCSRQGQQ
ncbi:hypothetical protein ACFWWT_30235 [Streptomyces sp. NPDC058676]|uniref:hypothetical protein n=1 Tax=unclassified Streptomyces TaxID=2593676 RepID=UPI00365BF75F